MIRLFIEQLQSYPLALTACAASKARHFKRREQTGKSRAMLIQLASSAPRPDFAAQIRDPAQLLAVTPDLAKLIDQVPQDPEQSLVPMPPAKTGLTFDQAREISFKLTKRANQGLKLAKAYHPQVAPAITGISAVLSTYEAWDAFTEKENFSPWQAGLKTAGALADTADLLMLLDPVAKLHPDLAGAVKVMGLCIRVGDLVYGGCTDVSKILASPPKGQSNGSD